MSSRRDFKIVGILNITTDSFSDGGCYLEPEAAIRRGLELMAEGADIVDLGAESSNPDGQRISAREEIGRLVPVIEGLKAQGVAISVDTYKAEVIREVVRRGADMINDITGMADPAAAQAVAEAGVPVVIMFARNRGPHAERVERPHTTVMDEIHRFFADRIRALVEAGVPEENIIIDPGMGLFLGANPEPSLLVLRRIEDLKVFGRPIYLSTSRKSFIGRVLSQPRPQERAIGTLATEIWGYLHGVNFIRTHEPGLLRQAVSMIQAIEQVE